MLKYWRHPYAISYFTGFIVITGVFGLFINLILFANEFIRLHEAGVEVSAHKELYFEYLLELAIPLFVILSASGVLIHRASQYGQPVSDNYLLNETVYKIHRVHKISNIDIESTYHYLALMSIKNGSKILYKIEDTSFPANSPCVFVNRDNLPGNGKVVWNFTPIEKDVVWVT